MNWPVIKLSELVEIRIGRTPSRSEAKYWGDGHNWLSIADMNQGERLSFTKESITQTAIDECKPNLATKGTVLFSFKLSIGKVGIAQRDLYHNEAIAALPIKDSSVLDTQFLIYALKNLDVIASTDRAVMGATLNKKKLAELSIPLPPLPIQKQIAAVLEKADNLRQQSQNMEQELNSLAQSVFLDMFGDPVNNTNSFETASIGELAHVQIGPFGSMLHKSDYIPGGIPLINPTHIVDQKIIPNDELTITEEKFNTLPQYHLKYGDIVMGRRGEMGRCAVVTEESQGYFCGTGSLIIRRTSDLVSSEYLASMLSCSSVKSWFERQSLGATMPNLNKGIVSKLRIPIPSQKVNIKYDLAKSKIQKSLKECVKRKNLAEDYFNSLMQRAFKGELEIKDVA